MPSLRLRSRSARRPPTSAKDVQLVVVIEQRVLISFSKIFETFLIFFFGELDCLL